MASWDEDVRMPCSMVQKAVGISRNALVNYERHGAVHPARDANGYRSYSRGDLLDAMCCTMLTSMGFSVNEAADLLKYDDLMSVSCLETYIGRLELQREVAEAKIANLKALKRTTAEALPPETAGFEVVDCPDWLFFFDEHESVDIRDVKLDNQVLLMRSLPLSCRGFVVERFFDGRAPAADRADRVGRGDPARTLAFRWGRTLRREHAHLLDVDTPRACVLGGLCVRVALAADFPDLDPSGTLRDRLTSYLQERDLRHIGDPFVPSLLSNRRPSPVFEVFVPVER